MAKSYQNPRLVNNLKIGYIVILAALPFHGFLTTWAGSNFGSILLWRAWKEIILVLALSAVAWLLLRDRPFRQIILGRTINRLACIFTIWILLVTVLLNHNAQSALLGLTIQLRLFAIFLLAQALDYYKALAKKQLVLLLLIPAAFVVIFGLLQMFVLPYDLLKHFGYVKNVTIPPFFTIDEQITKLRIASTLRGPNPLGVYLILPALVIISKIQAVIKRKQISQSILYTVFFISLLIALYGSHSRGAWLGFMAAIAVWVTLTVTGRWRVLLISLGLAGLLVCGVSIYAYRHTAFIEDVALHDNPEEGGEISSNAGHLDALKSSLVDIKKRPLAGCGAGCAGPASAHNPSGARLAENYFLQTAQEGGVIALALLLAIFLMAAWLLLQQAANPLSRALLAAFVGICVASLLAHAWADDTIAYLWWGIAGAVVYNGTKGKQHGKKKKDNMGTAG